MVGNKRITTIDGINMIQCGKYNWKVLKQYREPEIFRINLSNPISDITLLYTEGIFSVRSTETFRNGDGDFFNFKIDFNKTPILIESILAGESCELKDIYYKSKVKTI